MKLVDYAMAYGRHQPPEEMKSLTFSLLFTPEMVVHIPIKIPDPSVREIRVICPQCTGTASYPTHIFDSPETMDRHQTAQLPIVMLLPYRYTEADWDRDVYNHGHVWVGKCKHCNKTLYASKWKVETGIDRMARQLR